MKDEEKEVFETPEEKADRCDVFVDFGPMERSIWLTKEAIKRIGKEKPAPDEIVETKKAITPEERHDIYMKGIMAAGKAKDEAEEILKRAACMGCRNDPWGKWFISKLVADGKLDAAEWGE